MAFQTGTKVDPRLMRADLSGFSRGTELAMAGIGAAIKGYATKKKEKEQINFAAESLAGQAKENPYVRQLFGISEEDSENITAADFKPIVKGYGAKTALGLSAQINLLTTKAAMEGGDPTDITQFTNAVEKSGFRIDPKSGKLQKKGTKINPFGSGFSDIDPTKDKDVMQRVQVLRNADKKLFDQYFGSQFGTATTAPSNIQVPGAVNFTQGEVQIERGIEGYTVD
tara:strand:- start:12 stop:689 length:678 start_codon:yes stop_codon:yes gene_type:complete